LLELLLGAVVAVVLGGGIGLVPPGPSAKAEPVVATSAAESAKVRKLRVMVGSKGRSCATKTVTNVQPYEEI
jgi:hypothetical protein